MPLVPATVAHLASKPPLQHYMFFDVCVSRKQQQTVLAELCFGQIWDGVRKSQVQAK